jgi:hypothetical protein
LGNWWILCDQSLEQEKRSVNNEFFTYEDNW